LKVGPYNYWPSRGTITRDGMAKRFAKGGLRSFLYLLQTSLADLPRSSDVSEAQAPSPLPPVKLDASRSAGEDEPPWAIDEGTSEPPPD
jgi:hypothetical protein